MRRIKRFYNNIKNKTCFIRAVANQNEITYIIENLEYINYVIKKQNPNNEIVYLVEDSISVSSCIGHYYRIKNVDIIKYKNVDDLRNLFDTSYEFIDFCKNNFDESLRYHNLVYYLENRLKRMENELDMSTSNYQVLSNLESTDFQTINLPNNVIIYGAGNIGRILYNKIKCKCSVKYFIDENIDKKTYDMVPIIKVKELVDIHNIDVIIVTPIYDYNRICFNIHEIINDKVDIVSLKEFL